MKRSVVANNGIARPPKLRIETNTDNGNTAKTLETATSSCHTGEKLEFGTPVGKT